jgi:hypothetical protein
MPPAEDGLINMGVVPALVLLADPGLRKDEPPRLFASANAAPITDPALFSNENFSTDNVGNAMDDIDIDEDESSVPDIIIESVDVDEVPVMAFLL